MSIKTYIVDAFTDKPFRGNPAGVCLLESDLTEKRMQLIASELGLSETAFVTTSNDNRHYSIRFFSPKMEISLCGHATLAASRVLFSNNNSVNKIQFLTQVGLELLTERKGTQIQMSFPIYKTIPAVVSTEMLDALGIKEILNCAFNKEMNILLLEIAESAVLAALQPDYEALYRSNNEINGVLVTAPSERIGFDFESRYFWPWSGTNEDAVTGATHTFLTPYWAERLGKQIMKSYQCSARTGFMEVELTKDDRLLITSQAKIILIGDLIL